VARVLILVSKTSATAMMYSPFQLIDGLFQLSTFRGAGNVYSKLHATDNVCKLLLLLVGSLDIVE